MNQEYNYFAFANNNLLNNLTQHLHYPNHCMVHLLLDENHEYYIFQTPFTTDDFFTASTTGIIVLRFDTGHLYVCCICISQISIIMSLT